MPTPSCIPLDYIAEISTLLATCAPTYVGAEHITDGKDYPKYTWIPVREDESTDHPRDENCLGAYRFSWVVHVYGKDFLHTYRLRGALLTALCDAAQGTYSTGGCDWPTRTKATSGVVCLQTVSITIPLWVQEYPETYDVSGAGIVDVQPSTARATRIAGITPTLTR